MLSKTAMLFIGTMLLCVVMSGCACVWTNAQEELDHNPKLSQRGVKATVVAASNGYVTIRVEKGFSPQTMYALSQGKSLRDIQTSIDRSVDVLIEADEIIKKRPEVKTVTWEAVAPGESNTGGPGGDRDICYKDIMGDSTIVVVVIIVVIAIATLLFVNSRRTKSASS
jgi:hypothetical protein